jgi:hypothetical protein
MDDGTHDGIIHPKIDRGDCTATPKKKRQTPPGNDISKQHQQQQGNTNKKSKTTTNNTAKTTGGDHYRDKDSNDHQEIIATRLDPKLRGIHADAIQVNRAAPTSASTCVDCGHKIKAHSPRWGIKYAGNP